MWRETWARVDLKRLATNVSELKSRLAPNVLMMATVKANAYGHGAVKVSRAALCAGADQLGVATVDEGVELRDHGIEAPVLMYGALPKNAVEAVILHDLMPTVGDLSEVALIGQIATKMGKACHIHVKLDTGMGRLGVRDVDAAKQLLKAAAQTPGVILEGAFTHFSSIDEPPGSDGDSYTELQRMRFEKMIFAAKAEGIKIPTVHAANSAGMLRDASYHYDMVRPGIALYGYHPARDWMEPADLLPVLSLHARVVRVADLPSGEGVSYGRTFVTKEPERIATLPIGYADGIPRGLSNVGHVCIKGKPAPIVGRVCMDQMMIKVTGMDVSVGDVAEIYGGARGSCSSLEAMAELQSTIPYELLCRISDRVPRIYT